MTSRSRDQFVGRDKNKACAEKIASPHGRTEREVLQGFANYSANLCLLCGAANRQKYPLIHSDYFRRYLVFN
jgi:hypothetical protein